MKPRCGCSHNHLRSCPHNTFKTLPYQDSRTCSEHICTECNHISNYPPCPYNENSEEFDDDDEHFGSRSSRISTLSEQSNFSDGTVADVTAETSQTTSICIVNQCTATEDIPPSNDVKLKKQKKVTCADVKYYSSSSCSVRPLDKCNGPLPSALRRSECTTETCIDTPSDVSQNSQGKNKEDYTFNFTLPPSKEDQNEELKARLVITRKITSDGTPFSAYLTISNLGENQEVDVSSKKDSGTVIRSSSVGSKKSTQSGRDHQSERGNQSEGINNFDKDNNQHQTDNRIEEDNNNNNIEKDANSRSNQSGRSIQSEKSVQSEKNSPTKTSSSEKHTSPEGLTPPGSSSPIARETSLQSQKSVKSSDTKSSKHSKQSAEEKLIDKDNVEDKDHVETAYQEVSPPNQIETQQSASFEEESNKRKSIDENRTPSDALEKTFNVPPEGADVPIQTKSPNDSKEPSIKSKPSYGADGSIRSKSPHESKESSIKGKSPYGSNVPVQSKSPHDSKEPSITGKSPYSSRASNLNRTSIAPSVGKKSSIKAKSPSQSPSLRSREVKNQNEMKTDQPPYIEPSPSLPPTTDPAINQAVNENDNKNQELSEVNASKHGSKEQNDTIAQDHNNDNSIVLSAYLDEINFSQDSVFPKRFSKSTENDRLDNLIKLYERRASKPTERTIAMPSTTQGNHIGRLLLNKQQRVQAQQGKRKKDDKNDKNDPQIPINYVLDTSVPFSKTTQMYKRKSNYDEEEEPPHPLYLEKNLSPISFRVSPLSRMQQAVYALPKGQTRKFAEYPQHKSAVLSHQFLGESSKSPSQYNKK